MTTTKTYQLTLNETKTDLCGAKFVEMLTIESHLTESEMIEKYGQIVFDKYVEICG